MLFQRKIRPHPIRRLRTWLWPERGFKRGVLYNWHRLKRIKGSPHNIAAGFAAGAAISFTPFVGLHLVLSCVLSFFTRGNYVAAVVGTAVGNPLTFPSIWLAALGLGRTLLGTGGDGPPMTDGLGESGLHATLYALGWHDFAFLLWTMTVGGVPLAVAAWLVTYFPIRRLVEAYHHHRARVLAKRARRLARAAIGDGAMVRDGL